MTLYYYIASKLKVTYHVARYKYLNNDLEALRAAAEFLEEQKKLETEKQKLINKLKG
jgi:hypothetical protein